MKKIILLIALLFLPACTSGGPTQKPSAPELEQPLLPTLVQSTRNETTLVLWHNWSASEEEAYADIIATFNATYSELAIQAVKMETLSDALAVALPSGEGPDLIHWTGDQIGTLAQAADIIPLDEYLPENYLTQNFEPAAAQAMQWHEQSWGIPITQEGLTLIYNQEQLNRSDLPDPTDFNALLEKARAFRQENPGKYYLCNPWTGAN